MVYYSVYNKPYIPYISIRVLSALTPGPTPPESSISRIIVLTQIKESKDPIIAYLALHLHALDDKHDKLSVMYAGLVA